MEYKNIMKLERVEVRDRLALRRDPYYKGLSEGRSIGYRKLSASTPGTWLARYYDGEKYKPYPLGDFAELEAKARYDAAKRAAEDWFRHLDMGGSTRRHTVKSSCEDRVNNRRTEKSEAAANDAEGRYKRLVNDDPIAEIELSKLTRRHIADWKARVLALGGAHSSYNRNATALRAALNLSFARGDVATDHAWREELKPLENAGNRRTLYLDGTKRRRLIEKASEEARPFFYTLNLLPMRPGELASLRVDYLATAQRALQIPTGKTELRVIPLARDVLEHFKSCAKRKLPGAWLIARTDGSQWKKEAWRDEIKAAARKARLPRATVAYTLRHSVITDLVIGGLDLFTVAKISGTSVAMIEKYYGHLVNEHARDALEKLALA